MMRDPQIDTASPKAPSVDRDSPLTSAPVNDGMAVAWEGDDPENPYKWSPAHKLLILGVSMMLLMNSTMGSALPSNAIPFMAEEYGIAPPQQRVLPISIFMIGFMCGPILWGPLSEHFGRRSITIGTFPFFSVWSMACALTPNYAALVVFRLMVGIFASAPVVIVPGIIADIYGTPRTRGRAMAVYMAATCFGPLFAPIISGYCSQSIGWRWTFWVGVIYAAVTFVALVLFLRETLGTVLLNRLTRKLRNKNPAPNRGLRSPHDPEPTDFRQVVTVAVIRPLRMIAFELIVSCTCVYQGLIFAIFYMSFQAYPLIFQSLYGLSPGMTGIAFLPIGGGSVVAILIFFLYDPALRWVQNQPRFAFWANREEYRRLPLACLGGPLLVASLFWLGFTARENVSFAVPMLAGLPFGAGYVLIFMALLNYITDAYQAFSSSVNAAATMTRSIFAVLLPLATTPMFDRLGIAGACALLGALSAVMAVVPFIFIWKGETIRAGSKFHLELNEGGRT